VWEKPDHATFAAECWENIIARRRKKKPGRATLPSLFGYASV
jgi:hypothetical protein